MKIRRLLPFLFCFTAACVSSRPPSAPASGSSESVLPSAWSEEGTASWYGGDDGFEGKPTASGEIYDSSLLTAAHRELPLGTLVEVWNPENGKSVQVRINDRGPFLKGRIIDLSSEAFALLAPLPTGVIDVRLTW